MKNHDIEYYKIVLSLFLTLVLAVILLFIIKFVIKFFRYRFNNDGNHNNQLKIQTIKYLDSKTKLILASFEDNHYILMLQEGQRGLIVDAIKSRSNDDRTNQKSQILNQNKSSI